ncbi:hypothetical protein ACGFR8_31515 [Streptomyces brevispora]|uniref:hypothetical protein n=1 Tax=Streptomyces brevispora TaxID=887462 RepID=UPI0037118D72
MSDNDAPRVLRLTFEFHIKRGKRINVRNLRRFEAVNELTAGVQLLIGRAFPWAHRMTVRHEWLYAWYDQTKEFELPKTPENSPD